MCELLGMCFSSPIVAHITIRAFAMRDLENAHGWGLAWYRGKSLAIAKEPLTWRESKYASFLENYPHLQSHIYIGHVRNRSVGGEPKRADTHPFSRELWGNEYCFAHNGTLLSVFEGLRLGRFRPIGDTDSEHVFCHLLAMIEARERPLASEDNFTWLHGKLQSINEAGKFNCLFSDGGHLFCYHDLNGFKGLHLCDIPMQSYDHEDLDDSTLHVDLETDGATLGTVVATRPLNDEQWAPFEPGELTVLRQGRIVFSTSNPRSIHSQTPAPDERTKSYVSV